MIFASKNEKGVPAWKLVMDGTKTVTRRMKPQPIGAIRAVQPGRTKKAVGHIKILACEEHWEWINGNWDAINVRQSGWRILSDEAKKEGFQTWDGLLAWFKEHKININDTYRIEFEHMAEWDVECSGETTHVIDKTTPIDIPITIKKIDKEASE